MIDGENEEELLIETETEEAAEVVADGDNEEVAPEAEDEVEDEFTFGDEPAEQDETAAIRALRAERKRLLKELEDARKGGASQTPIDPGPEPELENFDYDETAFKAAWRKWNADKAAADAHVTVEQQQAAKQQERNQQVLQSYVEKRQSLARSDYQDAEDIVTATIDPLRQSIIVTGAEDPARLVYALGKNPSKLEAIASITDPVKFAIAIGKLEGQLRVVPKKKSPEPDTAVRGSSPLGVDAKQKRIKALEDKMAQGGDISKIREELKQLRAA